MKFSVSLRTEYWTPLSSILFYLRFERTGLGRVEGVACFSFLAHWLRMALRRMEVFMEVEGSDWGVRGRREGRLWKVRLSLGVVPFKAQLDFSTSNGFSALFAAYSTSSLLEIAFLGLQPSDSVSCC
jgi:hypothetical protein